MRDKGRKAVEKKANQLERLAVEYVAIDTIHPNDYNPNRQSDHDYDLLLLSMREDGFTQPIIVQINSREIVDGFHRWTAAKELGLTEIPVVFTDMTPEQMRIATLRHNRARGSEDLDLTAALMRDLEKLGAIEWAQDSLMLDDVELQRLLEDTSAPEALAATEFSDAWEPGDEGSTTETQSTPGRDMAMTEAAVETLRDRDRRMAAARTMEERDMVRADTSVYRLTLTFAAEEAEVVKKILEPTPAVKILELCRAALG